MSTISQTISFGPNIDRVLVSSIVSKVIVESGPSIDGINVTPVAEQIMEHTKCSMNQLLRHFVSSKEYLYITNNVFFKTSLDHPVINGHKMSIGVKVRSESRDHILLRLRHDAYHRVPSNKDMYINITLSNF